MDLLKEGASNLKNIGFGAAFPTETNRILGAISGETDEENKKKMDAMQAQIDAANRRTPAPTGMKKGGKVKSASARADGCCIRGKTRA
jgi:hypothetical protein